MFKCTGNCSACGKCHNIFQSQVEKDLVFPENFISWQASNFKGQFPTNQSNFGIAFDIGTTTVAAVLWNLDTKEKIHTIGAVNPQRIYGADVISRIAYCMGSNEKREHLTLPLHKTFENIVRELVSFAGISLNQIKKAVFCGNTTMTLLFAGLSTDGLAHFPFEPDGTMEMPVDFKVDNYNIDSILVSGIKGHLGGDIVCSMLASEIDAPNENSILLDLGTNGEVIANLNGKLYGFSTAAGPAFEGANISCGMSATVGAISEFNINENDCSFTLIKGTKTHQNALGVCGSGIMSAICNLLKLGIINKDGVLLDWEDYKRFHPYSSIGNRILDGEFVLVYENKETGQKQITITQDDIRQLQTAKAAILAGLNILFSMVDFDPSAIDKVYLAGGFSKISKVVLEGLHIFPFDLEGKFFCIGNGALTGASMVLLAPWAREKARGFSPQVCRVELGNLKEFQEEFLKSFKF